MLLVFALSVDQMYMRQAIQLGLRAAGRTHPNPAVGCVIVAGDTVLGQGFHPKAGEAHAEIFALRDAGAVVERRDSGWAVSNADLRNATAYVTLEPCSHFGKTPPCCDALLVRRFGPCNSDAGRKYRARRRRHARPGTVGRGQRHQAAPRRRRPSRRRCRGRGLSQHEPRLDRTRFEP